MLTALEVRNTCRQFKLSLDSEQQRRVARAYDLVRKGNVQFDSENTSFRYWLVQSQYDRGTYQVIQSKQFNSFGCHCPDARKHQVEPSGIQTMQCKHSVAAALEYERLQLLKQQSAD